MYILTAVTVYSKHKETFIYIAQALLFLAIYDLSSHPASGTELPAVIFFHSSDHYFWCGWFGNPYPEHTTCCQNQSVSHFIPIPVIPLTLITLAGVGFIASIIFVLIGFGIKQIKEERSFDLLMLLGTLVLPQLSAFGIKLLGWKVPVNATEVNSLAMPDILHMALVVIPIFIISIALGLWWNSRQWLINAGIWYVIYIVLYTSMFTNGAGFFTGLVGSLGYWLAQQAVNRGDQPLYYYSLIQIPIYEFLPALGSILAIILAILGRKTIPDASIDIKDDLPENAQALTDAEQAEINH
jgi:hypothetical protein